jgi:hypothetical protein|tara:strand:- start:3142 stop:3408 length:267 start_codon:yes stop_codon:yes gene_type:complete
MAKVTYNKDGTPRKKGSGRKKGSISLMTVKLRDLIAAGLGDDDDVVIGRKFNDELFKKIVDKPAPVEDTSSAADAVQEKIAYKLTTFD